MGRATSLVVELLTEFEPEIESLKLIPSDGGRFEVVVNEQTIFSKLQAHRHAEAGEVVKAVHNFIQEAK